MERLFYRVIGDNFCGIPTSGPVRRSREDAWEAWANAMEDRGIDEAGRGGPDGPNWTLNQARDKGCCRLVAGTSEAAVLDADLSETKGRIEDGEWWTEK